jgi:membrane protease YdiL (CAAX protease family)
MKDRPVLLFLVLVAVVSTPFYVLAVHYHGGTFKLMWSVTIATILTYAILKRDLRTLGWTWGPWRYQWLAFLIPLAYCFIAYGIIWSVGWGGFYDPKFVAQTRESLGFHGWSDLAVLAYFIPTTLFFGIPGSLSSAIGEEIGWRGFLVPELSRSMSFTGVALTSGIIWFAWHLPVILLGNYHNNSPAALPLPGQLLMFFISVVGAAVIAAYLRLKSGSLWTAAIFHACHNLFIQAVLNPLTVNYPDTPKYVDELGLVLPLTIVPFALYFLVRGRRELARSAGEGAGATQRQRRQRFRFS